MRLIVVSSATLALAAAFGLGVIVGKFVLTPKEAVVGDAPTNAIMGPSGLDNPLADPDAVLATDPLLNAPAPSLPVPPVPAVPTNMITARAESEAAMQAGNPPAACDIRVNQSAAIRDWKAPDKVTIMAIGADCTNASVRLVMETAQGAALYTLQAPAKDFGIAPTANADQIRDRLTQLLPAAAVRASAYPAWPEGVESPTKSEFSREVYEAIRSADVPVTCLKLPSSAQRCIARDPASGQLKVFARS